MLIVCDVGILIRNIERLMDFGMRFTLSMGLYECRKIFSV